MSKSQQLIQLTSYRFQNLFLDQKRILQLLPKGELLDLRHACDEVPVDADYSVRVAADINQTAVILILEENVSPAEEFQLKLDKLKERWQEEFAIQRRSLHAEIDTLRKRVKTVEDKLQEITKL